MSEDKKAPDGRQEKSFPYIDFLPYATNIEADRLIVATVNITIAVRDAQAKATSETTLYRCPVTAMGALIAECKIDGVAPTDGWQEKPSPNSQFSIFNSQFFFDFTLRNDWSDPPEFDAVSSEYIGRDHRPQQIRAVSRARGRRTARSTASLTVIERRQKGTRRQARKKFSIH